MTSAAIIEYTVCKELKDFVWHIKELLELCGLEVCIRNISNADKIKFKLGENLDSALNQPYLAFSYDSSKSLKENMQDFIKNAPLSNRNEILDLLDFTFNVEYYRNIIFLNSFVKIQDSRTFIESFNEKILKPLFKKVGDGCEGWEDEKIPVTKFVALKLACNMGTYEQFYYKMEPTYHIGTLKDICQNLIKSSFNTMPGLYRILANIYKLEEDPNHVYETIVKYQQLGFKNSPYANRVKARYWKEEARTDFEKAEKYFNESIDFLGADLLSTLKLIHGYYNKKQFEKVVGLENQLMKSFARTWQMGCLEFIEFHYVLESIYVITLANIMLNRYSKAYDNIMYIKELLNKIDKIWVPSDCNLMKKNMIDAFIIDTPIYMYVDRGNYLLTLIGIRDRVFKESDFILEQKGGF